MSAEPISDRSAFMDGARCLIGRLVIIAACTLCAPFAYMALVIGLVAVAAQPGIGDVESAQAKIEHGMTRDEVRSRLGRPHREGEYGHSAEWDYWETKFVGSVLRVHFGADGRVTSSEWWVQ